MSGLLSNTKRSDQVNDGNDGERVRDSQRQIKMENCALHHVNINKHVSLLAIRLLAVAFLHQEIISLTTTFIFTHEKFSLFFIITPPSLCIY